MVTTVAQLKQTFTFHSDPGHAWLEVTPSEVRLVGLNISAFSSYSYVERNDSGAIEKLYLEEDCDAPQFINAYRRVRGEMKFNDHYQENTFARTLPNLRS